MTNEEISKRIEELEFRIFLTKQADFMSRDDWEWVATCEKEIKQLKEQIK